MPPPSMQPLVFSRGEKSLLSDADTWWIQIMGRIQPGVKDEQARPSLAVGLVQAISSTMSVPKNRTLPSLFLLPGGRGWNYAEQQIQHPMPYLVALAGFVLLLSCVSVANLLPSRCASRNREISTRLAIGANHKRITRQLLTESLSLAIVGGAMGLLARIRKSESSSPPVVTVLGNAHPKRTFRLARVRVCGRYCESICRRLWGSFRLAFYTYRCERRSQNEHTDMSDERHGTTGKNACRSSGVIVHVASGQLRFVFENSAELERTGSRL